MIEITFITADGTRHLVTAQPGLSLMEAAVHHMVPGIGGDCGGACACATCHIWIDPDWWEKIGDPEGMEADMLEGVDNRSRYSRLGCQIRVEPRMDSLVVSIPYSE